MPTKLSLGSPMFWYVSSVTATPWMPPYPSALAFSPATCGSPPRATSANTRVMPSAPTGPPPPVDASNARLIGAARLTGVVQNALPAES